MSANGEIKAINSTKPHSHSSLRPPPTPLPLPLPMPPPPPSTNPSITQQAFKMTSHLANILPTGTIFAFELLIPIFTKYGSCDLATRVMTLILLIGLVGLCILACITDSITPADGHVSYGFVTSKGLWLFDSATTGIPADLTKYKLGVKDVLYAVLSVMVFFVVAFKDKNVIGCFYPVPGHVAQDVLDILQIGVGAICSILFILFSTRRHGMGHSSASSNI